MLSGLRIRCCSGFWYRLGAAAQILPLAQEFPYVSGTAIKRKKKKSLFVNCESFFTPNCIFLKYFKANPSHHTVLFVNISVFNTNIKNLKNLYKTIILPNKISNNFLTTIVINNIIFLFTYHYYEIIINNNFLLSNSIYIQISLIIPYMSFLQFFYSNEDYILHLVDMFLKCLLIYIHLNFFG